MKSKVAIAVSAALMSVSASSMAELNVHVSKLDTIPDQIKVIDSKKAVTVHKATGHRVFTPETDLDDKKYRYMVRLIESPVALYQGGIEGFKATSPEATQSKNRKLDVKSKDVIAYRDFLNSRQENVIAKINAMVSGLDIKQRTNLAYNGMVIEMTQNQAMKVANVPGIAHIKRETLRYTQTDAGPGFIKAPGVWDGSASGTASKGEGMIVGIIDTGINTDNASFADVGGDGYDHTNPWGTGTYSGDCATEEWASLCNDKLIGVHSYPTITDQYADYDPDVPANGEDHNGHGSHTAGTTAGNVLVDVGVPDVNGGDTGVVFESMSGVAPHANIVSYQVCLPGENDAINFRGCYPSLTVLAVEHAIESGVDALNYSIGGGSSDPWQDADALSFLSARKAGIHVATSAGNSGPGPETVGSPGDAPWITTVAAYSHDRGFSDKTMDGFTGGDTDAPSAMTGKAMTGAFSGPIVYAGDYANPNDPDGDPAQCLKPFPAGTFPEGSIVVCDRGAIARVDKGRNAKAGGAAALVLANIQGGATSLAADAHVVPAIHIDADNGDALRTWLASGEGHMASISGTEVVRDESLGNIAADFTSRGPNASVPDVIVPSIAAPGLSIFAAYADDQSAGFKESPDPVDFTFLQGTSMASPHVAGALALLADIHPEWTPAEAQSALMLTANQNTYKDDGVTKSDFFDMGAGYANVTAAAATGLVMDESFADYMKADPTINGTPSQINLATMANSKCVDTCTWTRTVKATKNGSWTVADSVITEGLTLSASPASFTLEAGQTQEITISADVTEASAGWNFGNIVLTADGMPEVKMPVAVKADGSSFPDTLTITAQRDSGSVTYTDLKANGLTNAKASIYDKTSALIEPTTLSVPEDGFDFIKLTFDETVPFVVFSTSSETAPDVDLRILDASFTRIGRSAGATSDESVTFTNLPAGDYYAVVDGYAASTPGGTDEVLLEVNSIIASDEYLSDSATASISQNGDDFELTVNWSGGEEISGILEITSDEESYKTFPINVVRGKDDVEVVSNISGELAAGVKIANAATFTIAPNFSTEDKVYTLSADLNGHDAADITDGGTVSNGAIYWNITRAANESNDALQVSFSLIPRGAGQDYAVTLTSTLGDDTVSSSSEMFSVPEVAPVAMINAPVSVREGSSVTVDGSASYDANGDDLTYTWTQTAGKPVSFSPNAASLSFEAPQVSKLNDIMSFNLQVDDGNGNVESTSVSINVLNKKSSGGSFGWLLLAAPLVWLRRKIAK